MALPSVDAVSENMHLLNEISKLRDTLASLGYSTWQCNNCKTTMHASQQPSTWCCKRHQRTNVRVFCDQCIESDPVCSPETVAASNTDDSDESDAEDGFGHDIVTKTDDSCLHTSSKATKDAAEDATKDAAGEAGFRQLDASFGAMCIASLEADGDDTLATAEELLDAAETQTQEETLPFEGRFSRSILYDLDGATHVATVRAYAYRVGNACEVAINYKMTLPLLYQVSLPGRLRTSNKTMFDDLKSELPRMGYWLDTFFLDGRPDDVTIDVAHGGNYVQLNFKRSDSPVCLSVLFVNFDFKT